MTELLGPVRYGPVTRNDMAVWADVLRDPNPIHFDAEIVRARGLGDAPIVQGTVGLAFVATMLQDMRPALRLADLRTRFTGVAFQDEVLEVSAEVLSEDAAHMRCRFRVHAVDRADILSGEAEMRAG